MKKTLIAVAAGALICGAWGTAAMAMTKHKVHTHRATTVAQADQMIGNNPMLNPKASATTTTKPAPAVIKGNNPMAVAVK